MSASRGRASSPPAAYGVALLDREFAMIRALIANDVGIQLGETKRALVVARLGPRLRALGLRSFAEYYTYVTDAAHADERVRFVDSLCTNETSFFRERWQFDYLEQKLVPTWLRQADDGRRERHVRVWSAACSTGDEPYSIAMLLGYYLRKEAGWRVSVLATDISSRVLGQAEEGVWKIDRSTTIPTPYLRAFMLRGQGEQEGLMKASPELRAMIRFQPFNLQTPEYPAGDFDLVFCRNVLIYFDARARTAIVDKLLGRLVPTGHLFLGHAEGLVGRAQQLRTVAPSVYALRDVARAPDAPLVKSAR